MTTMTTQAPETVAPFTNEPVNDFSDPADVAAMKAALATVRRDFGKSYPLVIGGRKIETEKKIRSLNPARSRRGHRLGQLRLERAGDARRSRRPRTPSNPGSV